MSEMPETNTDADRPCTCHPDDNPPVPCAKQYALSDCRYVAEIERLREVLSFAQHKLSMAKIWGGMGWHFNPLHPVHYLPALDKIEAALAGVDK